MYVLKEYIESIIDLPASLPLTEVRAADWLIVATVKLLAGQQLAYRYGLVQVYAASINGVDLALNDQCNPVTIRRVNPSYGLAYLGIAKDYSSADDPSRVTWQGTAADVITAPSVGVYTRNQESSELIITEPGNYSFVVVNNCVASSTDSGSDLTNVDLQLVVTAQIRLQ